MVGDTAKHEVMSFDEIEAIKERSSGWKAYKAGYTKSCPWLTDWAEMAKKTVFRRCSKWLPLSAEIMEAFDRDAESEDADATSRPTPTPAIGLDALAAKFSRRANHHRTNRRVQDEGRSDEDSR